MKKTIFAVLFSVASLLGYVVPSFAQSPTPVEAQVVVMNFGDLNKILNVYYTNVMKFVTEQMFVFDPFLPTLFKFSSDKAAGQAQATTALSVASSAAINLDLADQFTKTQNTKDLEALAAGDDNPSSYNTSSTLSNILSTIFATNYRGSALTAEAQAANESNNAVFNAEVFLGLNQYNDKQQAAAEAYIRYLVSTSGSPTVIRLGQKFDVPYSPDSNKSSSTVTLPDGYSMKQLQSDLSTNDDYNQYKLKYRAEVAARSLFINNVLRAYQRRLSIDNKPSLVQIDYDEANRRLDPSYYKADPKSLVKPKYSSYYEQMQDAPPATIARETLFVLAEIRKELYEMRMDQERLIIMQSMSGLQGLNAGQMAEEMKVRKIARLIYCTVPGSEYKDSKDCQAKGPGADVGISMQAPGQNQPAPSSSSQNAAPANPNQQPQYK
jgi:hypothetical protein